MNFAVVIMMSNYLHDLATGLLFGSIVAYFLAAKVVSAQFAGTSESQKEARIALYLRLRPVVVGALAAVLLLGIPRMIFYDDYEWLPAAGRGQITALVLKHIVLVSVTLFSLIAFFRKNPAKSGC